VTANKTGMTSAKPASYFRCHAQHCIWTSAGKVFHKLKAVSIFRWLNGNQRWYQQADYSTAPAASSKLSFAAFVTGASAIVPPIVPRWPVPFPNVQPVTAINKAAMAG
jgi:hypothetical protein